MAMRSRLVCAVAVLGGLWSAPALGQEGPLPDLRPAGVDTAGPRPGQPVTLYRRTCLDCTRRGVPLLAVIDGVPYPTAPPEVRPQDIESITVVRPPESVERYGEAARHGAALIRTRKPLPPPNLD